MSLYTLGLFEFIGALGAGAFEVGVSMEHLMIVQMGFVAEFLATYCTEIPFLIIPLPLITAIIPLFLGPLFLLGWRVNLWLWRSTAVSSPSLSPLLYEEPTFSDAIGLVASHASLTAAVTLREGSTWAGTIVSSSSMVILPLSRWISSKNPETSDSPC